jgi:hypothetical protein
MSAYFAVKRVNPISHALFNRGHLLVFAPAVDLKPYCRRLTFRISPLLLLVYTYASILRPSNPPSVPYRRTTLPLVEQAHDTGHRFRCQNEQSSEEAVVNVVHQVGQIEHA